MAPSAPLHLPYRALPNNVLAVDILGPQTIGMFIDLALQGYLTSQFIFYFSTFPDDAHTMKLYVGILAVSTYLRSGQLFSGIWTLLIRNFGGNLIGPVLNISVTLSGASAMVASTMTTYVQSFFLVRLYRLSRWWPIVGLIGVAMAVSWSASVVAIYYSNHGLFTHLEAVSRAYDISQYTVVAADLLITFSTAFGLMRSRKLAFGSSVRLVDQLIRLTFQTAAPATIATVILLIFSHKSPQPNPVAEVISLIVPKIFACAMLWTVNARNKQRREKHLEYQSSSGPGVSTIATPNSTLQIAVHVELQSNVDISGGGGGTGRHSQDMDRRFA